ncbi:uncharacterized protein LOC105386474 [Plutella xylostella]|uniref:uncharacterized protein LOC105386474 n=1 Tax=Plutella xylostella TaxID=51655 RepID=UPI0020330518|nr:uncharacterized protein LOC105386474 [Plutella xylostella]
MENMSYFDLWNAIRAQMAGLPWTVSPNYIAMTYENLLSPMYTPAVPYQPVPQADQAPNTSETKFVQVLNDKCQKLYTKPGEEEKMNNDQTGNKDLNETKNDLKLNMITTTSKRIVELPQYKTRRQELLKAKKPVCTYKATILKNWTQADYVKKCIAFKRQVAEEREKAQQRAMMGGDITSQPVQGRVVKMPDLCIGVLMGGKTPQQRSDRWYLVAETKVLLEDHMFIDKLARTDSHCRIRLPYEVVHDLVQMTHKRHPHWMRIPARRLANYIHRNCAIHKLVIGQTPMEAEDLEEHPFATDMVLNLCMQLLKQYFYVVLISNDPERKRKATALDMPCYTLAELHEMVTPKFHNYKESNIKITCTATSTQMG